MFHIIAYYRKRGNGKIEFEENRRTQKIRLRVRDDILDLDYDDMSYAVRLFDSYRR